MDSPGISIYFVHNWPRSFVLHDVHILRDRYIVTERFFRRPGLTDVFRIPFEVASHSIVFAWFASWHAFLPLLFARLLGRPSILVIGGYDVADLPEIGYGHQRGGWRKWLSRLVMRLATRKVSFSEYSRDEAFRNAGVPREDVDVVYLGVPDAFETCDRTAKDPDLVLTVGGVKVENLHRKGHLPFVQAAAMLPEKKFVLVGGFEDDAIEILRVNAPENVRFTGWVDDQELEALLLRAKCYVQPSMHEGFGLSVAEAMLAECIPVVSRVGSLPEVVGDAGLYLGALDARGIAEGVQKAEEQAGAAGSIARERILREFSFAARAEKLYDLIDGLLLTANQGPEVK